MHKVFRSRRDVATAQSEQRIRYPTRRRLEASLAFGALVLAFSAGTVSANTGAATQSGPTAWTQWMVGGLILFFAIGLFQSVRTYFFARRTLRCGRNSRRPSVAELQALADEQHKSLPYIVILVPARDESAVIHNTLNRLAQLDYPHERFAVVVITDARERSGEGATTTREVALAAAGRWNTSLPGPVIHVIEVPEWYSGRFGDSSRTSARSTKGRALNYALEYLRKSSQLRQADMLGLLDADGRLHREVLREVAGLMLTRNARLMQGPVFQVSNLRDVGLSGKAAGVELSVYHLSTLARQLQSGRKTARFLAGTNYFVDPRIMMDVGGWDDTALVEDAELGLRLYLRKRLTPAWLSCFEVEQTPPDMRSYLRQRHRWTLGHFQLLPIIRRSKLPLWAKLKLHAKILHSILMCPFDVGLPILSWVALGFGWAAAMPAALHWVMLGLMVGSIFVWDYFGRGVRLLNRYASASSGGGWLWALSAKFVLAMPWLMVLQALPRITALLSYIGGRDGHEWHKTPRTIERRIEPSGEDVEVVCPSRTIESDSRRTESEWSSHV